MLSVGGQTSARRKGPTGTIPGNQAIKQEANAYCNGVGKAYNQINGGSANGDAFVD
jgi:hypothetical protein